MRQSYENPSGRRFNWIWALSFMVLTAGTFWVMVTAKWPEADIPYSFFIEQVISQNVAQAQISDVAITGTFVTAVQWSPESNASIPDADAIYSPSSFTNFRVLVPRALGESSLVSLLEQHGVEATSALPPQRFLVWLRNGFPILLTLTVGAWIVHLYSVRPGTSYRRI